MKKYLELSNILMITSFILTTTLALYISSTAAWYVWLSTILGILASKSAKDGKWYTFLFDIISYIFYLQVCINQKYYGEFILAIIIIIFNIFCLKEWKTNSPNNLVKVNLINKNEIKLISFIGIFGLLIYTIILHKFNSNLAFINSICTISFMLGNYFCFRRSVLQFYSLIVYEIAFILLWTISALNNNISSILFLIGGTCELVYDILAIAKWNKLTNMQKHIKCKTLYFLK